MEPSIVSTSFQNKFVTDGFRNRFKFCYFDFLFCVFCGGFLRVFFGGGGYLKLSSTDHENIEGLECKTKKNNRN